MAHKLQTRMGEIDDRQRPQRTVIQEAIMAKHEKDAYLALIAARDPPSLKAKTDRDHTRSLQQGGYQVELSTACDEHGHPWPTLSAAWRKR
jgi:hypothetical protein